MTSSSPFRSLEHATDVTKDIFLNKLDVGCWLEALSYLGMAKTLSGGGYPRVITRQGAYTGGGVERWRRRASPPSFHHHHRLVPRSNSFHYDRHLLSLSPATSIGVLRPSHHLQAVSCHAVDLQAPAESRHAVGLQQCPVIVQQRRPATTGNSASCSSKNTAVQPLPCRSQGIVFTPILLL
ncbi:hypothetical protein PIB30_062559 [Stylosanthes scabra]|uniref:Uncharacterized protein n=1 Tax=Stylosanthes scabra TaxID=79078 RepID=A0ABU6XMJ2_9FABA|nr:hypothetical protein [Stylosanthes scabra]